MYVIEVIEPDALNKSIICNMCEMSYAKDEYEILRKNKKLIYFKWDTKSEDFTPLSKLVLCHGCLFKMVKKIHPNQITNIKVLTKDFEYDLNFDPSATPDDENDEDLNDEDFPYLFD